MALSLRDLDAVVVRVVVIAAVGCGAQAHTDEVVHRVRLRCDACGGEGDNARAGDQQHYIY